MSALFLASLLRQRQQKLEQANRDEERRQRVNQVARHEPARRQAFQERSWQWETQEHIQQPIRPLTNDEAFRHIYQTRTPKVHRCAFCNERHLDLWMTKDDFEAHQEAVNEQLTEDVKNRQAPEKAVQQYESEGRVERPSTHRCELCQEIHLDQNQLGDYEVNK
ncbi:hypothetical protein BDZ45DRAFT_753261 [Acephala macrosclerotiorum]|nr:hypothetical protein BDZ45DRAFT_753261 [Acephala macrosclerotiorum]